LVPAADRWSLRTLDPLLDLALRAPSRRTAAILYAATGVAMVAVACLDAAANVFIEMRVLYLLPMMTMAWFTGFSTPVLVAAAVATAAEGANEYQRANFDVGAGGEIWNSATRLGVYLFAALLVAALRSRLLAEHTRARVDPLTGVANTRRFTEAATGELARATRYHHPLSLALVDLDNFKAVNDVHGHPAGDRVLAAVAAHLVATVRATDLVARLGGDEFAVLCPETGAADMRALLARLPTTVGCGPALAVSFSIGAVSYDDGVPTSVETMLAGADAAMYDMKAARNPGEAR
jgi:diguanylate cyclase (GGDEF)-like protein